MPAPILPAQTGPGNEAEPSGFGPGGCGFESCLGLPFPLTDEVTWLGAAIPSFLVAFAAQLAGAAFVTLVNPSSSASPVKEERSG